MTAHFKFMQLIEIIINSSGYLADPAGGITCILCHDAEDIVAFGAIYNSDIMIGGTCLPGFIGYLGAGGKTCGNLPAALLAKQEVQHFLGAGLIDAGTVVDGIQ